MARKRIESPDAHDGLIDRSPSLMPQGRQPHFQLTVLQPGTPSIPARPTLPEDDDREAICDAVLAERQAAREKSRSWLDIACARSAGFARQEMSYAQMAAAKILSTLYRTHPEIMAEWPHDRRLFEQLDAKGWDFQTLTDLHMQRCPHDLRKVSEIECRRALAS